MTSVHNISLSADLDMSRFNDELNRSFQAASQSIQNSLGSSELKTAVRSLDAELDQLMKFANADETNSARVLKGYGGNIQNAAWELRRELGPLIHDTDALRARLNRLGIEGSANFDLMNHAAVLYAIQLDRVGMEEDQATLRARMMGREASQAFGQMNQAAGQTTMVVGQLGYAIEDFFTVYEYMGAGGAFRAAANNLAMVARTIIPSAFGAGLVAVAISLGPTLWRLLFSGADDEVQSLSQNLSDALSRLRFDQEMKLDQFDFELKLKTPEIPREVLIRMDAEELSNAAAQFGNQIRESLNQSLRIKLELENNSDQVVNSVSTLMKTAMQGVDWNTTVPNAFSDLEIPGLGDIGTSLLERANQYRSQLEETLKLAPESAEAALRTFQDQMTTLNEELTRWRNIQEGEGGPSLISDMFESSPLDPILDATGKLLGDKEALSTFEDQIRESQQEQQKLQQNLAQAEKERLGLIRERQELEKLAENKARREAVKTLFEAGMSDAERIVREIRLEQQSLEEARRKALGENPAPDWAQAVGDMFGKANRNFLLGQERKFNTEQPIDRLAENFSVASRSVNNAAMAAMTSALKQIQSAKETDPNTEVLKEIRDALKGNSVALIPVNQ